LTLLLSLLTTSAPRLLLLPPPSLLALASTLSVHPAYTTRATAGPDARAAADSALNLLRHVVRLASPLDAEFASAFAFAEDGAGRDARRRRRGRRARDLEANVGADDEDEEQPRELVDVELAGPGSVFVKGEDWWRVFGWAMNCAARSAGRWARWGLWLDVMVDALERDWAERERVRGVLGESLIALYLGAAGADGRTGRRRIMRAVFANGDDRAMREFGEIWKNETKERLLDEVAQSWRGKRKRLDIDEGDFGDYARDEEGEEEVEVKGERQGLRSSARGSRPPAEELEEPDGEEEEEDHVDATSEESYGGWQAMAMRRRVLVLVSVRRPWWKGVTRLTRASSCALAPRTLRALESARISSTATPSFSARYRCPCSWHSSRRQHTRPTASPPENTPFSCAQRWGRCSPAACPGKSKMAFSRSKGCETITYRARRTRRA